MTILVWGLLLEILSVIYLSPTPWKFEFAYSLILFILTSIALVFMIRRSKASVSKNADLRGRKEDHASPANLNGEP